MNQSTFQPKSKLLVAALVIQLFCTINVFAKSSVWKISKGGDHFYLGGTFHLLSPDDHPLPEEFLEAYTDAQEMIFETDMVASGSPAFQAKMMGAMMYGDGRTLSSELDDQTYSRLKEYMDAEQLPIAHFDGFQPWGLSLILTMHEYTKLGMDPQYGVETYFGQLASADEKLIQSLETPDQQLEFLESLGTIGGGDNIDYTLRDLARVADSIKDLKVGWRSGDLSLIENNESVVELKEEFPEVYDILIVTRNNNWMKQLVTLFDDNAIEIVLVGAMHLVGEDGLINQLQSLGFKVEQLD